MDSRRRILARPDADPVSYGRFDAAFVDELAGYLGGTKVLEIFAGNGLLSSMLSARGVDVLPTTRFSSHDGNELGIYADVVEADAVTAVAEHGPGRDVLLVSWPTTTEAMTRAALEWGSERPIVFVGEITRPDLGMSGLGGCATDSFFEMTDIAMDFRSYRPRGLLERAVVMHAKPDHVERYRLDGRGPGAGMVLYRHPFG